MASRNSNSANAEVILILTFSIMLVCCSNYRGETASYKDGLDSLTIVISNFKIDSLGCLGLRSKNSIDFIYLNSKIEGKPERELLDLLGKPNDTISANGKLNLRYYFDSYCSNGFPIDSVEKCWSNFQIDIASRKVLGVDFVCQ